MQAGILCPYVWLCAWIDPKRYIIGGTYCIFFIYIWAYLSLEEALGIDIYYIIDTQFIILFWRNFKIVLTYCIFYGYIYIFRAYFVLWVHGVWVGAVCYSYGRRPAFNHSLLALLSIYCIKQVYKAIKNKDLDILDWISVPRGTK